MNLCIICLIPSRYYHHLGICVINCNIYHLPQGIDLNSFKKYREGNISTKTNSRLPKITGDKKCKSILLYSMSCHTFHLFKSQVGIKNSALET